MNFLITLIRLAVVLMMVFFVVFFGGREIILYWASAQVITDVRTLTIPQRWREAATLCSQEFSEGQSYDGFQLRFLNDRDYNLEVHCLSTAPGLQASRKLPGWVKKTTGSAGFFYNYVDQQLAGEITLELWGQRKLVFAEGDRANQVWGISNLRANLPASVCQAHGLRCCDPVQEVGKGDLQSGGVTDCPASCYTSCQQRPLLLSFQTDPPLDYEQRQINLSGNTALVLFNFVFDDRAAALDQVTIDYGDGTTEVLSGKRNGQFSKEYACATPPCLYQVKLIARDVDGNAAAASRIDRLTIELGAATVP